MVAVNKARILAGILGTREKIEPDSETVVTSFNKGTSTTGDMTVYTSIDELPATTSNGTKALITSTNSLYIYNNGWYRIALINNYNPQWDSDLEPGSSYTLSTTGANTTITILAVDSDDVPLIYSVITDSDFDSFATITHDSDKHNVWTVTPTDSENGVRVSSTGTVTFRASDGVNLVVKNSTFSITFTPLAITDSRYTTFLLKATNDSDLQVDESSNNYTLTPSNGVYSSSYSPYSHNPYMSYGTTKINTDSDFAFGLDSFCIEGWVYGSSWPTSSTPPRAYFVAGRTDNTTTDGVWEIGITSNAFQVLVGNTVHMATSNANNGFTPNGSYTNKWFHFCTVRKAGPTPGGQTGAYEALYIDGHRKVLKIGATSRYYANFVAPPQFLYVGGVSGMSYIADWPMYLRDVRITKGKIPYPDSEYIDIPDMGSMTTSSGLVDDSDTVLLLHSGEGWPVNNGTRKSLTYNLYSKKIHQTGGSISYETGSNNLSRTVDTQKYNPSTNGGSIYFDGTANQAITAGANCALGSGDFTAELWVYVTTALSNYGKIFDWRTNGTAPTNIPVLNMDSSRVIGWYETASSPVITSSEALPLNNWVHIAVVRNGTTTTLYQNGVAKGSYTGGPANLGVQTFTINNNQTNQNYATTGYFSDIRIVTGTAVYTSNFDPPTAPLTAISGTQLLTGRNKAIVYDATGSFDCVVKYNNDLASTTQQKWSGSPSLYFDGNTGNSFNVAANTAGSTLSPFEYGLSFNSDGSTYSRWTFEAWLYILSAAAGSEERPLFVSRDTNDNDGWGVYMRGTSQMTLYSGYNNIGTTDHATLTTTFPTNQWFHFVATNNGVGSGSSIKYYIDGTNVGQSNIVRRSGTVATGHVLTIGNSTGFGPGSQSFHGYMQDVRFTRGFQLYTSNFTPPTAEFDG